MSASERPPGEFESVSDGPDLRGGQAAADGAAAARHTAPAMQALGPLLRPGVAPAQLAAQLHRLPPHLRHHVLMALQQHPAFGNGYVQRVLVELTASHRSHAAQPSDLPSTAAPSAVPSAVPAAPDDLVLGAGLAGPGADAHSSLAGGINAAPGNGPGSALNVDGVRKISDRETAAHTRATALGALPSDVTELAGLRHAASAHLSAATSHGPHPAASRGAKAASSAAATSLHLPRVIDLGDTEVGRVVNQPGCIINTHATEPATLEMRMSGDASLSVHDVQRQVQPGADTSRPTFTVQHAPRAREQVAGALMVHAQWHGAPAETHAIAVTAKSHLAGETTHAEEAAYDAQSQATQQAQAQAAKLVKRGEKAKERNTSRSKIDTNAGEAVLTIYQKRHDAITKVAKSMSDYRRAVPPIRYDVMSALAASALELAITVVAGGLVGKVAALLTDVVSKAAVTAISDGLKLVLKQSAKAALSSASSKKGLLADGSSPENVFEQMQYQALWEIKAAQKDAFEAMYQITYEAEGVETAAEMRLAFEKAASASENEIFVAQVEASSIAWMRYLSQLELGAVSADEAKAAYRHRDPAIGDTTKIERLLDTAPSAQAPKAVDGVLELTFAYQLANPWAPVQHQRAHMTGVRREIAKQIRANQLASGNVPVVIRARGVDPTSPDYGLLIVRDEAGNLEFRQAQFPSGATSTYLESRGRGDARQGAQMVLAELLADIATVGTAADPHAPDPSDPHDKRKARAPFTIATDAAPTEHEGAK